LAKEVWIRRAQVPLPSIFISEYELVGKIHIIMRNYLQRLRTKYCQKRCNAGKEKIPFLLTFKEYCQLLDEAEITADDIGIAKYHLARYNDEGPYKYGNCRFIHYLENVKEKKISIASIEASKRNVLKAAKAHKQVPIEIRREAARKVGLIYGGQNILSKEEVQRRLLEIENSGIDLTSYGWVTQVAKLFGFSHTQARRFINTHYQGVVYSRK